MKRLRIIDFDDTLAWSGQAVETMRERYPEIPERDWWHDPNISSQAVEITKPITGMWRALSDFPEGDEVIILTGRVLAPVLLWLSRYATHPDVVDGLQRITDVVSTSDGNSDEGVWPVKGTAARKALQVMAACDLYDEIHVYDDHPNNLMAITGACPHVRAHQIVGGHLINRGARWTWERRRGHFYPDT